MVITSALLLLLLLLAQQHRVEAFPCAYPFWAVNTRPSNGDTEVTVACLDAVASCAIAYAPVGCGCNPACAGFAALGPLVAAGTVQSMTLPGGATFSQGDRLCFSHQASAVSLTDRFNEWPRGSQAGTRFAYGTYRNANTRCVVAASANGATATIQSLRRSDGGILTTLATLVIPSFGAAQRAGMDARDDTIVIISDELVTVSCAQDGDDDYTTLIPVSAAPLYTWVSNNLEVQQVNCATLVGVTSPLPACISSADAACSPSLTTPENLRYTQPAADDYAGPAVRLTPAAALCLSATPLADLDGTDGTTALNEVRFSDYFVVHTLAQQVAVLSAGTAGVSCEFRDATGALVAFPGGEPNPLVTTGAGTAPLRTAHVAENAADEELGVMPAGVVVSCSAPVMLVIDNNVADESNVHGREATSLWTAVQALECPSTQAPSLSPATPAPSASPEVATSAPTGSPNSPTSKPTGIVAPTLTPTARGSEGGAQAADRGADDPDPGSIAGGVVGGLLLLMLLLGSLLLYLSRRNAAREEEKGVAQIAAATEGP